MQWPLLPFFFFFFFNSKVGKMSPDQVIPVSQQGGRRRYSLGLSGRQRHQSTDGRRRNRDRDSLKNVSSSLWDEPPQR